MSVYENVIAIQKNLSQEFKELSEFQSLEIASKIVKIEAIKDAFGVFNQPTTGDNKTYLEEIAEAIKYLNLAHKS